MAFWGKILISAEQWNGKIFGSGETIFDEGGCKKVSAKWIWRGEWKADKPSHHHNNGIRSPPDTPKHHSRGKSMLGQASGRDRNNNFPFWNFNSDTYTYRKTHVHTHTHIHRFKITDTQIYSQTNTQHIHIYTQTHKNIDTKLRVIATRARTKMTPRRGILKSRKFHY